MFYKNMVNVVIVSRHSRNPRRVFVVLRELFLTRKDDTLVESMGNNCKNLGKYVVLGGHNIGAALIWSSASEVWVGSLCIA